MDRDGGYQEEISQDESGSITMIWALCRALTISGAQNGASIGLVALGDWSYVSPPNQYQLKLRGLSPQANYTDRLSDRRLSAKLVPTLADRRCRVVSATIPPQSNQYQHHYKILPWSYGPFVETIRSQGLNVPGQVDFTKNKNLLESVAFWTSWRKSKQCDVINTISSNVSTNGWDNGT
jgi:hypothetical protein